MMFWRIALALVVIVHMFVVVVNFTAFFVLPFTYLILDIPFWFSILLITPIESLILFLSFNRTPCPMTLWENSIRRKLGKREIGGFIGYYIIKRKWMRGTLNEQC